jgi:hypothetical protein
MPTAEPDAPDEADADPDTRQAQILLDAFDRPVGGIGDPAPISDDLIVTVRAYIERVVSVGSPVADARAPYGCYEIPAPTARMPPRSPPGGQFRPACERAHGPAGKTHPTRPLLPCLPARAVEECDIRFRPM